jgi:diguanylate cyclase (GGDEF)-like protein
MKEENKTKKQLINELIELRQQITEIEGIETERRQTKENIQRSYDIQTVINSALKLSLEDMPLEEFLKHSLDLILSIPWLSLESKGSIFLVGDQPEVLVMKIQKNLPEEIQKLCARIPFGRCICGKAALTQEPIFIDHLDENHEIQFEGMSPHGHYCVPILFGGKTLGVVDLYVKEGHHHDQREKDFLTAIANTLAGILIRRQAEERIEYLAYYDALTGLPNRNLFIDRMKQGIARAEPTSRFVGVLITDIKRFKSINDTYGSEFGDRVLKEVAERLSNSIREGDTVARLGNDEFGIALIDIACSDDIIHVLEKIMKSVSQPMRVSGEEITLTFNFGISMYPHDGKNADELSKSAGLALTIAKKEVGKTYQFYTEDMNIKASEFIAMEKNLRTAITNEEFVLHYQPYWDINTKKIVGMEALVRWQSKDMGLVSPGKFIPVLEDTGMIIEVGEWILRTALRQIKEWQDKGYPVVPISVNLSLIQFRQKEMIEMVKKAMREFSFHPSLLTLEITESAFMQDIEYTNSVINTVKDIGISISIDDFGTGYSSLAYLKRFPIDNLKIDISFIREITTDTDTASIVTAIIAMAHTLNLKTIAEGIETEEQWKFLRLLRCDMGQGYYISKPLPAEDAVKLLIS